MKFHRSPPDAPEINLIPFIDILLVVLIFLVLTTTYQRQSGLNITLPTTEQVPESQRKPRVQVAIDTSGQISLDGQVFSGQTLGDLRQALNALAPRGSDTQIVIHADAQTAHQRVVDVMTAARMAGLSKVVFAVRAQTP